MVAKNETTLQERLQSTKPAAPWRGIGKPLTPGAGIETWLKEAGLNWEVEKVPVKFYAGGYDYEWAGRNVLLRADNHSPLAIVSSRYKEVQPREIFGVFEKLSAAFEDFDVVEAGPLYGGTRMFAIAKCQVPFKLSGDTIERYLFMATSYDKTWPTFVMQMAHRPACTNVLTSLAGYQDRIAIRHMAKFDVSLLKNRVQFNASWNSLTSMFAYFTKIKIKEKEARKFFLDVFYTPEQQEVKGASKTMMHNKISNIMTMYRHAPGQQVETAHGTLWGAVNAVTYFTTHGGKPRTADSKLERAVSLETPYIHNRAIKTALQFAHAA